MSDIPKIVKEMGGIKLHGNCIPPMWYKTINYRNKRGIYPHLLAINLLADIVYWYTPSIERDEKTGKVKSVKKKFASDKLQRSYSQISEFFGCSKEQAKDAVLLLEFRGLINKEFRTIQTQNGPTPNVLFLEPVPEQVKKYTDPTIDVSEFTDMGGVGEFTHTYKCKTGYVSVNSPIHLRELTHTNTKTTTKTTTETTHKRDFASKAAPQPIKKETKNKPVKRKSKATKKDVAPSTNKFVDKPAKEPSLHTKAKERFEWWHKQFTPDGAPIYWSPKEIGQLTQLLNRLQHSAKSKSFTWANDEQFLEQVFDVFCKKFIESGQWYADCFVPSSIVSKWNIIIQTLHENGKRKTAQRSQSTGVTDSYKARIYAALARN